MNCFYCDGKPAAVDEVTIWDFKEYRVKCTKHGWKGLLSVLGLLKKKTDLRYIDEVGMVPKEFAGNKKSCSVDYMKRYNVVSFNTVEMWRVL